jgi:hypothetical protein
MIMNGGHLSSFPELPVPPAVCCKRTAGLGGPPSPSRSTPTERKMNSWYAKLPDWQIGVTWLVITTVAGVIYFVPLVRLLAPFAH